MQHVSKGFLEELAHDNRNYLEKATITLADQTVLNITNEDIWQGGFSVEDSVYPDDTFAVGGAIINKAKLVINNIYGDYDSYDFQNAKVEMSVGLNVTGNTINYPYYETTKTQNGLTFTDNGDGTITVNGTSTATTYFYIANGGTLGVGRYTISGCPSGGTSSTYRINLNRDSNVYDYGNGATLNVTSAGSYYIRIVISSGKTINNVTFAPSLVREDGMNEFVNKGKFTVVDQPQYNGSFIIIEAIDNMYKFDIAYSDTKMGSKLGYPATLDQIVRDACSKCDVVLGTLDFPHKTYVVQERPSDDSTTFREVISWAAQIAGCYARINVDGKLELKWFDVNDLADAFGILDGGIFDGGNPYYTGAEADGGSFNPWDLGFIYNVAGYSDLEDVHQIYSIYSQQMAVDDTVITGVRITVKVESVGSGDAIVTTLNGTEGYVMEIDNNPFITTSTYTQVAQWLGTQLVGMRFRKLNISHASNPSIEAGDIAIMWDRKRLPYPFIVSRTLFSTGSPQSTVSGSDTPSRNSAARFSLDTKNYVQMRKLLGDEKTDREQALDDLVTQLNAQNQMFIDKEFDASQNLTAIIIHNKPLVADSDIIWKITTNAFGVSTDGGQTYNLGATADGTLITQVLQTVGINAEWITTGTLTIGGQNNTHGTLRILDASGTRVGYWDNSGLYIGNIASNLTDPNTKLATNGAITTKSLTATNYIYMNGTSTSSMIKIPFNNYVSSPGYAQLSSAGMSFYNTATDTSKNYLNLGYSGSTCNLRVYGDPWNNYTSYSHDGFSVTRDYAESGTTSYKVRLTKNNCEVGYVRGGTKQFFYDYSAGTFIIKANTTITGNLSVSGTKPRLVTTKDYGERYLYCYETPSPLFGDVGEGKISDDGKCYVQIDGVFAETVTLTQYQVFLQKYGDGDCWVKERNSSFFIVEGTPGLKFGWEIKAKQSDFDQYRLEKEMGDITRVERDMDEREIDYGQELIEHIATLKQERMVNPE